MFRVDRIKNLGNLGRVCLITTFFATCALALPDSALGCVGTENVFNVNLESKSDEGIVVQLSWRAVEFGVPALKKNELEVLDDDGFLSYYLAYVKINSVRNPSAEISASDLSVLSSMEKNANHLKAYITARPSMLVGSPEERAMREKILGALDRLEKLLNPSSTSVPIKLSELESIHKDLRYYSSWAAYKTRRKGQTTWSNPVPFTKIELPKVNPVEDLTCNSTITVFNDDNPEPKAVRGVAAEKSQH